MFKEKGYRSSSQSIYVHPLTVDISPDGKAHEWSHYDIGDKQVMVLDEYNIHTAKESELKIVDWERTYFLTNTYFN